MKKIKKLLALIMAMTMVLGLGLTSFAADGIIGNSDDSEKIQVTGLTPEVDTEGELRQLTVTAYQIIEAQYDEFNGNFTGYNFLYEDIIVDEDGAPIEITDYENEINEDVLNQILADIRSAGPSVEVESYEMTTADGVTYTSVDEVPVGSYLVVIEGAETKVYSPVVASVYYVNEDGTTDLSNGIVNIASDPAWVKVSSVPTIDKTVSDTGTNTGTIEEDKNGISTAVGENVTYTVKIDPIPYYGGEHPVLNVIDTLSSGLSLQGEPTVKVVQSGADDVVLQKGTDYTYTDADGLTAEGETGTFRIDFVVAGSYTLNDYVGDTVVITYTAKVTENAVVNEAGNDNNAELKYTTDSKTTGHDGGDEDKTYTYTFDIDGSTTADTITKVGEDTDEKALGDAVFGLYKDLECTQPYTNESGTLQNYVKDGETLVDTENTVTSDDEGQLHISGLAAGTYYLKELYAPAGYSVNTHVFTIEINAKYNETDDKLLDSWEVKVDGKVAKTFKVDHTEDTPVAGGSGNGQIIQNTKIPSLPSTGGIGTTIFTIGGCVIMIAAAALFFVNRRKSEEN